VCLIAFAWQVHVRYPLIVAGNRDEYFARPTASARWSDDGGCLSGLDLHGGGTWMGVSRSGRFAALTNHRGPAAMQADALSRGRLCPKVLTNVRSVENVLHDIADEAPRYNGFNLLAGCWNEDGPPGMWTIASPGPTVVSSITPGVHALSNARVDTPWPKVERAKNELADAIGAGLEADALIERLFTMLRNEDIADDASLPSTGIPLERERALSAAFIRMPGYGTRSSTVLLVDRAGHATFVERRSEPDLPIEESRHAFDTVTQRTTAMQASRLPPTVNAARAS